MTLTTAMEEAYASNPHGEIIIETVELDHVTFDQPVRVASNVDDDISLPLTLAGDPVLFKAMAFEAVMPGETEDGPTSAKIRIKDALGVLTQYLNDAIQSDQPIEVTWRAYTTADLAQPGDEWSRIFLKSVDQDATGAEGTLFFQEIDSQAFPLATYDETYYPTLQSE